MPSTQITTTTSTYTLVVFYVVGITYYFCVPAPAISHQAMEYPGEFSYCVWDFLDVHEGIVVDLLIDAGLEILLLTIGKLQLSR